jgi:hypothetical protein
MCLVSELKNVPNSNRIPYIIAKANIFHYHIQHNLDLVQYISCDDGETSFETAKEYC